MIIIIHEQYTQGARGNLFIWNDLKQGTAQYKSIAAFVEGRLLRCVSPNTADRVFFGIDMEV